jgi:hypothetical protein
MKLVASFRELVQSLVDVMTAASFQSFGLMLTGWIFARRRTVSRMILAADAVGRKHHSAFHRLFAAAHWSLEELGLAIFGLMGPWLGSLVYLAIDDTLARKNGLKIHGVGMHHDPLLSTRKTTITNWGHSWVVLGVILRFPFCSGRVFCLPILFRLYISKQTIAKKGGTYLSRPDLAVQLLQVLCNRFGSMHFHALADSAYGGHNVLSRLPANCDLTSRLHLDARLHEPLAPRHKGQRGRPRKRGKRRASPRQMLKGPTEELTLAIYGRKDRSRIAQTTACLYHVPGRLVRIVAVQPLSGGRRLQAFYSTCASASAAEVLTGYAMRWSIEESFQASKTHLGFEEPQGWTALAVERTAPVAMLLYSLIVLWFAQEGHRHYRIHVGPWYLTKEHASFADMLTTLRCQSLKEAFSTLGLSGRGSRKALKTLLHLVQQAA